MDGRVDDLKKRCCMGFDAAQHGVMSTGGTFQVTNAERSCIEGEGSIFDALRERRCGNLKEKLCFGCTRALNIGERLLYSL